jgi:uroporphyrinogen decarboxylase
LAGLQVLLLKIKSFENIEGDLIMTPRERFIAALERKPLTGRVPHFELVFYLTMEAFGKVHPLHRGYGQWDQMEEKERQLHRNDMADVYIATAEKYEHSAIFLHPNPGKFEEVVRLIDLIREKSGDKYFLMLHGDATYGIPDGNNMEEFSYQLIDEPEKLKQQSENWVNGSLANAERYKAVTSLDGFALCSDYCLNVGPFLSPNQFSEFVTPYLTKLIKGYRDMGYYTIKHTDGNIMPIIDQMVSANPHALHSIDPQAGVDIAEVKRLYGDKVCIIGNVNCGKLDTGTDEECAESVRYALRNGMPGGGYIFSTSNCVYTGMKLKRYEDMLDIWRVEGNY